MLCIATLIVLCLLTGSGEAQMIADIRQDVQTEFGVYHPYVVTITPQAEPYEVAPDFSNVKNFSALNEFYQFSETERSLLLQNYFIVRPGLFTRFFSERFKQIFDVYKDCKEREIPIFVTTDAMLHTFHVLYDYALRVLEVQRFAHDLDRLNKAMLAEMERLYHATTEDSLKGIVRKNVAYFAVATKLKDPTAVVPPYVADLVQQELDLIAAHQGFTYSPIFGYKEDYSQYVPRGHYTRNEILETYFKSMMWYGRMMFRVEPDSTEEGIRKGKEETLQAILIVKALNEITVDGEPALDVWERIYQPTVFFVGKSDDLDVYDYTALLEEVYGPDWMGLSVEDFADDQKLTEFVAKAKELRDPLISSSWVWDEEDPEKVTKAFRFMGQRFIPDSYMFQQLVYDEVLFYQGSGEPFTLVYSIRGPIRGFPRGLDVMAVLGSQMAEQIIRAEGDADYINYNEQLRKLKEEFAGLEDAVWAQNLYWNWLYALMPLLEPKGEGYPPFMQNDAWTHKQLLAALGSWAELRHDTILYAKQSYTGYAGIPPVPEFTYGYVEPNPHLFARLASLADLMRVGLESRGLLLAEFRSKLLDFQSLLLGLKTMAEKELTNRELTPEEYETIWTIGEHLERLLTFSEEVNGQITSQTDEEMAVVADVHTDPNSEQVLEEGVGYPFELYVIVKIGDDLVLTRGGGFSYYEFKHPMSDRLTDEAWQEMLKGEDPPAAPAWTGAFMDTCGSFPNPEPRSAYLGVETLAEMEAHVSPANPVVGETLFLEVRARVFSDSTLTATFCRENGEEVASTSLTLDPGTIADGRGDYIGRISTSGWDAGTIMLKISHGEHLSYTHWFELLRPSGVRSRRKGLPSHFALYQNYPNPFNSSTTIRYQLPVCSHVTLKIYNLLGQKVRTLVDKHQEPGYYEARWDGKDGQGKDVASGVYFYKIKASGPERNFIKTMKLLILR